LVKNVSYISALFNITQQLFRDLGKTRGLNLPENTLAANLRFLEAWFIPAQANPRLFA